MARISNFVVLQQGWLVFLLVALNSPMVLCCAGEGEGDRTGGKTASLRARLVTAGLRERTPMRALWVTRWDYRSAGDVRTVVDHAFELGVTDLLWQVRGEADAYYRSEIEPFGKELFGRVPKAGEDPGIDPLEVAVGYAHARGIRIHAWINVFPLWKGTEPPVDPEHALISHPEWRLMDEAGKPQPLNEHYVVANPVRVDVHDRVVAVCRDLVTRYDIDGLHLDYIRFVSDTLGKGKLYPGDAATLKMFEDATGLPGVSTTEQKQAFRAWIRDRITRLVWRVRNEVVKGSGVELTAAVWRRPEIGSGQYLQDAARWLNEGLVDRVMPMIYTADDGQFASDLSAWKAVGDARQVVAGIGVYKHDEQQTARQIEITLKRGGGGSGGGGVGGGFALFAYGSIFESVNPDQDRSVKAKKMRTQRRMRIKKAVNAIKKSDDDG